MRRVWANIPLTCIEMSGSTQQVGRAIFNEITECALISQRALTDLVQRG